MEGENVKYTVFVLRWYQNALSDSDFRAMLEVAILMWLHEYPTDNMTVTYYTIKHYICQPKGKQIFSTLSGEPPDSEF